MLERTSLTDPIIFNASPDPTIGVEMELWLVDPETRRLKTLSKKLIDHFDSPPWVKKELWQCMVEVNTDICRDVAQARADLKGKLDAVQTFAEAEGIALISSGTHPFADWREQHMSEHERYAAMMEVHQWPAWRLLISGLHVHVGVDSPEKAIALVNAVTSYIPHLLALSASSPFWHNRDTGLDSSRSKVFEGMPKAGISPELVNWGDFTSLMRTLLNSSTIRNIRDIWWDVRPHPGFGTVEIRICDALPTLSENMALVALVQSLVVHLGELYERGQPLPILRPWTRIENKWRGIRYGLEAKIIRNETGATVPVREHIEELLDILSPTAEKLGCLGELEYCNTIMARGNSATRQRRVYDRTQDMRKVVDLLVEELKTDTMHHEES